jgi:hypothetical protein
VRSGKTDCVVAAAPAEEGLFFGCGRDDRELAPGASVDMVIVQTLGDEYEIRDAEVDGQSDHSRHEISPDSSWNRSIYARDQRQRPSG